MGSRRIAITGASGYLGSTLAQHMSQYGQVVALTRSRPAGKTVEWRQFELDEPTDSSSLSDVDVLIHSAWVLSGKDAGVLWQQNVVGSRRLFEAAAAAGVERIIFISSMSAYFGTRQTYGLMKLAVERTVLDMGGIVIRPGLVYGDSPGGMAGTLRTLSKLPIWPRFASAKLFLVHDSDVGPAMAAVIDDYDRMSGEIIGFANPTPLNLSSILFGLSPTHRRHHSVPVPAKPIIAALRVLEHAGVPMPFRSDSLLGLVEAATTLPGQNLVADQHISFRALDA
jgi:nucleoside-diphosphate-sugar epimerase